MNKKEMLSLLKGLGDTEHQVALALKAAGVKGTAEDPVACPVARYLHLRTQEHFSVGGIGARCVSTARGTKARKKNIYVALPSAITHFVVDFDRGVFPELIDPERPRRRKNV